MVGVAEIIFDITYMFVGEYESVLALFDNKRCLLMLFSGESKEIEGQNGLKMVINWSKNGQKRTKRDKK